MNAQAAAPLLLVFAKEPVAGEVKTRLATAIGNTRAAEVYRELTTVTLGHAKDAREAGVVSGIELWGAPSTQAPYFRSLAAVYGATLHQQCAGDLGARMAQAIADALLRARAVLLIGTDCPLLDAAQMAAAGALLRIDDAVLLPATDGGYALIGARCPLQLDGVRWSTAHALADTIARLARDGVRHSVLPPLWDVDEPADLARWEALRRERAAMVR